MGNGDNANPAIRELFFVVEDGRERERRFGENPPLHVWREVLRSVREFDYPSELSRLEDIYQVAFYGVPILDEYELYEELVALTDWAIDSLANQTKKFRTAYFHFRRSAALLKLGEVQRSTKDFLVAMSQAKRGRARSEWFSMGRVMVFEHEGDPFAVGDGDAEVAPWVLDFLRRLWRLRYPKKAMPKALDDSVPSTWEDLNTYFYGPRSPYQPAVPGRRAHFAWRDDSPAPPTLFVNSLAFGKVECVQIRGDAQGPKLSYVSASRQNAGIGVDIRIWPGAEKHSTALQFAHLNSHGIWLSGTSGIFLEAGQLELAESQTGIILFCFITGPHRPRGEGKVSLLEISEFLTKLLLKPELSQLLEFGSGELPVAYRSDEMPEKARVRQRIRQDRDAVSKLLQANLETWSEPFRNIVALFGYFYQRHPEGTDWTLISIKDTYIPPWTGTRNVDHVYLNTSSALYRLELHQARYEIPVESPLELPTR
jgi:hypothetical protein